MRVLVIGRSGQLASELLRASWTGDTEVVAFGRPHLDATSEESIALAVERITPHLLVNASAYTAVDRAQSEPARAHALNAEAPGLLAAAARRRGIPLIHVSTDYVFDGGGTRPWREDDPTGPQSVYGATKCEGEENVRLALAEHLILRTSWVFASSGQNFVRTMLRLGASRDEIAVVDDQIGCPTPAADLARVVAALAASLAANAPTFGTYHYCGAGAVSWYGFARAIFERAGDLSRMPRLEPITTEQFGAAAPRPRNSVLDCTKIARDHGISQRPWSEGLDRVLDELRDARKTGRTP